jgi:hypothetical protein
MTKPPGASTARLRVQFLKQYRDLGEEGGESGLAYLPNKFVVDVAISMYDYVSKAYDIPVVR